MRQKRERTIFVHGRLRSQLARHGESPAVLAEVETILDPGVLTIGFARRFATYKRAGLLFTDMDRLARLLWHADRPVQVIFAGKAHPADRPGQRVIQEIFQHSRSPSCAAGCSSLRTTTSGSRGSWYRASTPGSTTRVGRWKPPGRRG